MKLCDLVFDVKKACKGYLLYEECGMLNQGNPEGALGGSGSMGCYSLIALCVTWGLPWRRVLI